MTWAAASFLVLGFCGVAVLLRLGHRIQAAREIMTGALAIMRDKGMSDREKEKAVQKASGRMLLATLVLVVAMTLCVAIPVGIVWLAEQAGWANLEATLEKTFEWEFLLGASAVVTAAWLMLRRRPDPADADSPTVG